MSAYDNVCNIFGFIMKLGLEILSKILADIFINTFEDDIDEINIKQEIVHFSNYIKQINLPQNVLFYEHENNLKEVFPNTLISLRVYLLTLPISNCETEGTNSKLELIENVRRTSLHQEKLNLIVFLSTERV